MEDPRTEAARAHFDRWSATYEQDRASRRLREIQTTALAMLALMPDDELLDIACGTGAAVRGASPIATRAVGFDLSPAMVARARERAAALANVEFFEGDVSGPLPFADGEFTAVLCTTAFHHFPRPQQTIVEIARVLAPGGRLLIADANGSHPAVFMLDLMLRIFQRSHVGCRSPAQLLSENRCLRAPHPATPEGYYFSSELSESSSEPFGRCSPGQMPVK
ncbi:MAG: methyltransferase domain-containing protein [Solirubrobacterales bacterium]|nr:methyltransferase domain-containing protein [Solirubrobacterales bacterium]